ncbi:MAG TPA: hypothetical protein VKZ96_07870 [Thermomicrobiales bacterium]|nr:hypothetical protein [Thermomicrobiales bacterium]
MGSVEIVLLVSLLAIVGGVLVLGLLFVIFAYNRMVSRRNQGSTPGPRSTCN